MVGKSLRPPWKMPHPPDPGSFIPPTSRAPWGHSMGRMDPDLCILGKTTTVTVIVMVTKQELSVLVLTLSRRVLGVGPFCRWVKGGSELWTSILQRSLSGTTGDPGWGSGGPITQG